MKIIEDLINRTKELLDEDPERPVKFSLTKKEYSELSTLSLVYSGYEVSKVVELSSGSEEGPSIIEDLSYYYSEED